MARFWSVRARHSFGIVCGMRCFILLLLCLGASVAGISCRRQDVRTVLIEIPEMTSEEVGRKALNAASTIPGVMPDKCRIDLATKTLVVVFDSLNSSVKNIEFAIADVGLTANNVPANAEALKRAMQKSPAGSRPGPFKAP